MFKVYTKEIDIVIKCWLENKHYAFEKFDTRNLLLLPATELGNRNIHGSIQPIKVQLNTWEIFSELLLWYQFYAPLNEQQIYVPNKEIIKAGAVYNQ